MFPIFLSLILQPCQSHRLTIRVMMMRLRPSHFLLQMSCSIFPKIHIVIITPNHHNLILTFLTTIIILLLIQTCPRSIFLNTISSTNFRPLLPLPNNPTHLNSLTPPCPYLPTRFTNLTSTRPGRLCHTPPPLPLPQPPVQVRVNASLK